MMVQIRPSVRRPLPSAMSWAPMDSSFTCPGEMKPGREQMAGGLLCAPSARGGGGGGAAYIVVGDELECLLAVFHLVDSHEDALARRVGDSLRAGSAAM